jgi:hypothetical protein
MLKLITESKGFNPGFIREGIESNGMLISETGRKGEKARFAILISENLWRYLSK